MIRQALLKKLSSIEPTIASITYTYDIGIGFVLITKDGMYEEIGWNLSEWPLYRFPVLSQHDRDKLSKAMESESVDIDVLKETTLGQFACLIEEYNDSANINYKVRTADFAGPLKSVLLRTEGDIYAYCSLESWPSWHREILLFASYKEMEADFIGRYELTPWVELDDEDIEPHLAGIESPGLAFHDVPR